MFPFWEAVIAPLIDIVAPRRVVEIGALRGETTAELLESLGAGAELHVIDPVPQFDPAEHERRFAGRYVFHRNLSLRALPQLELADLALIDGDHNWYTVYHELDLLQDKANEADAPGPVFVLHDVGWPYGRRDGYYAIDNIPEGYRQPCARRGMARGESGLLTEGGLNTHIWNASSEGGPRNGVRTALEDFTAAQHRLFGSVVIELYTGLAVLADVRRLAQQPALSALFEELDSEAGRHRIRAACDEVVHEAVASGALTISSVEA